MPRFYVGSPLREGRLELPEAVARHVGVLRLRAGDAIVLFDGSGGEFEARLARLERRRVEVELGARRAIERESPLAVTLAQAVSSGERMDLTIQKSVELGVAAIQPLLAERSVARLAGARAAQKLEHWRRVAIAACEQCGRNRIPEVRPVLELASFCASPRAGLKVLLSPGADRRLKDLAAGNEVTLAAGPEGGYSPAEEAMLEGAGFVRVRLGARVLRTETAAPAALAALNALRGDF